MSLARPSAEPCRCKPSALVQPRPSREASRSCARQAVYPQCAHAQILSTTGPSASARLCIPDSAISIIIHVCRVIYDAVVAERVSDLCNSTASCSTSSGCARMLQEPVRNAERTPTHAECMRLPSGRLPRASSALLRLLVRFSPLPPPCCDASLLARSRILQRRRAALLSLTLHIILSAHHHHHQMS